MSPQRLRVLVPIPAPAKRPPSPRARRLLWAKAALLTLRDRPSEIGEPLRLCPSAGSLERWLDLNA